MSNFGEPVFLDQSEYAQSFTTDLPNDQQLAQYLKSGFANTGKDYSPYLAVLDALGAHKGDRVLDFVPGDSRPYDLQELARWTASNRLPSISKLDGVELLIVAQKPSDTRDTT
jgi:hypothetical protein